MIDHAPSEPMASGDGGAFADLPGLRTFRSARFRLVLAAVLLIIGVMLLGMLLIRQASAEDGQFGIDFADYYAAAERMAAGASPYTPAMLEGPVDTQGVDRYRYPPLVAQALVPLTAASMGAAEMMWLALQAAAALAAVWVGTGIGGAEPSVERLLWCAVAVVFFWPVFDTLWKGNVMGFMALAAVTVALSGIAAGVSAGVGSVTRAMPGTLLPAVLVADKRSRWTLVGVLGAVLLASFALAPGAWIDYPTVVLNMLRGSADYANNLAPTTLVDRAGLPQPVVALVRLATLVGVAASIIGSVWLARSREGLPAAALLGVIAMLLLPESLWYHYLAMLLPFAAIAWVSGSSSARVALFAAAALVTLGVAWLPLALFAAAGLAAVSLAVIWPRRVPETLALGTTRGMA